jgi:outer membrane protein OmpA-like peptidoglycan-associated protein
MLFFRKLITEKSSFYFSLFYVLCLTFCICQNSIAQTNKKAAEAYQKSTKFFAEKNFDQANRWVDETLKYDSTFAEAHFRKGQLYEYFTQPEQALGAYRRSIDLKPDWPPLVVAYQKLIEHHLQAGAYSQARRYLEGYLPLLKPNSAAQKKALRQLQVCAYGEKAVLNPLVINPEELSDTVNQFVLQYFPALTADSETLLFTALKPEGDEDLLVSYRKNGTWTAPVSISENINTVENEGTGTLSADGRTLVFTACNRRDGYGSCDLYISYKTGQAWSRPKNLGVAINSPYWESQASLSADGQKLYFVSDRVGGAGQRDIWFSKLQSNGQWTAAQNAGSIINSNADEASPFLHANGRTLFFASEGHQGLGGYDLFFADSTNTGWQVPRNLGYPINTSDNQVALFITSDGKYGYYSFDTKRIGNQRVSRLYRFILPDSLRQQFNVVNYLKGTVTDAQTGKPLQADIELYDLKTSKVVAGFSSDATTGNYVTVLPNGSEWGLYVNAKGYYYKSLSFDFTNQNRSDGLTLPIQLDPLTTERRGVLNNIYFETAKADLQEKSQTELNKLIQFLRSTPTLRVEIEGHTDDVGEAKPNQVLSQKRAQHVADYLVAAGIDKARIKAVGYGKTRPRVPNTSETARQLNRRIEWHVW